MKTVCFGGFKIDRCTSLLCDPNPNSPWNSEVAWLTTTSSSIG
ncbi:hypothetical protein HanIR_Chr03g0123391 [Helianthus annuus]|nr:hypothetical protein HanIR_Chr03g0123391 [Helianthus annuus]